MSAWLFNWFGFTTRLTNVEMVSILLWRKFTTFLDDAVPAIVSSVLVDFLG
jgi:hypothetical protein